MSRAFIVAQLADGPRTFAEMHAAYRRAGFLSKSVSGLHEMKKCGEVLTSVLADGTHHYRLSPAIDVAAVLATARTYRKRDERVPLKRTNDPVTDGKPLGAILCNLDIIATARRTVAFSAYHGRALLVVNAQRMAHVYVAGTIAADRAACNVAEVVGTFFNEAPGPVRARFIDYLAEQIEHHMQLLQGAPPAPRQPAHIPAQITDGVPQS